MLLLISIMCLTGFAPNAKTQDKIVQNHSLGKTSDGLTIYHNAVMHDATGTVFTVPADYNFDEETFDNNPSTPHSLQVQRISTYTSALYR